ncbi:dual oxidase 2-like [Saccoglossus kowalevskii]
MKSFKKGIMQRMNSNKIHPQNLRYSSLENNRIQAVEWRGSEKKRKVEIKIGPQNFLHVYDKMGSEVRVLNFDNILEVTLKLSSDNDQQLLLIHSDKEYDLVLMFVDVEKRDDFVNQLCSTLENSGVGFIREYLTHRNIIRHAYTHQKRKKKLEKFFKVIFAKVLLQ